jgi:hypothetical protein
MNTITPRKILIGLVVLVAAILLLTNRFAAGDPGGVATVPAPPAVSDQASAEPSSSAADTHVAGDGDDGVHEDPPILVKPSAAPNTKEAALSFSAAWLNTYGQSAATWRSKLVTRVTPDLAEALAVAEPSTVPGGGKVGAGSVIASAGVLTTATIPVVAATAKGEELGTLTLVLVNTRGTWLVSEIDWEQAGR